MATSEPQQLTTHQRRRLGIGCLVLVVAAISTAGCANPAPRGAQGPVLPADAQQRHYSFDENTSLPAGSQPFSGDWQVRAEPGTPSAPNTLCQVGNATFPAIALGTDNYRDVRVTTRFKAISGKQDQAAGIIARVVDGDNYFILRANALEGNVNLYSYVNGSRKTLAEGAASVESGRWQELRLDITGNTLTGYLDGKQVVTTTSDLFTSGRIGLWTKADSQTCFDNTTATAR